MNRNIIYERINKRVDVMIKHGLIEEVRNLINKYSEFPTALQGLGYKEVVEYLNGITTRDEMIEKIKQETRRYAKRQITWFKRYDGLTWLDGLDELNNNIDIILRKS